MDRRILLLGSLGLALPGMPQLDQCISSTGNIGTLGPAENELYTKSFAVLIGITYPKFPKDLQIPQANSDVDDLKALLVSDYGFLPDNIVVLKDPQATKKGIEKALAALADRKRVMPTDRVLVYFSCHGQTIKTQDGGNQGFLIPGDAEIDLRDTSNPVPFLSECIPMDGLWRYLEACPARHRLLIADACFAGLTVQSKALPKPSSETIKGFLAVPALQAIVAGGKDEEAFVLPGLRNSAFTHKLLEFLRLAAASGEIVVASLLGAQLKTSVPNMILALSNGKYNQTPQFGSRGTEGEWLFIPNSTKTRLEDSTSATKPALAIGGAVSTSIRLQLRGVPAGAKVTVNGAELSGNVYTADIVEKEMSVEIAVVATGYKPYVYKIVVPQGGNVTHDVVLETVVVRLELTGVPDNATVTIDGRKLSGSVFQEAVDDPSKSVNLEVHQIGYEKYTRKLLLPRGTTLSHNVVLALLPKRSITDFPALKAYVESMQKIPAGSFQMGRSDTDLYKKDYVIFDQRPVHSVTLSSFSLGATPVTVAIWKEYCGATGTRFPVEESWDWPDDHPIVKVSWYDIMGFDGKAGFCQWATTVAGIDLTLPTEAQFEYAARGGKQNNVYPWGKSFDDTKLWCAARTRLFERLRPVPVNRTAHVFRNEFGLTDMTGNVSQWCSDYYGNYSYSSQSNPVGPDKNDRDLRCVRGRAYFDQDEETFKCGQRGSESAGSRQTWIGFRLTSRTS